MLCYVVKPQSNSFYVNPTWQQLILICLLVSLPCGRKEGISTIENHCLFTGTTFEWPNDSHYNLPLFWAFATFHYSSKNQYFNVTSTVRWNHLGELSHCEPMRVTEMEPVSHTTPPSSWIGSLTALFILGRTNPVIMQISSNEGPERSLRHNKCRWLWMLTAHSSISLKIQRKKATLSCSPEIYFSN